MRFFSVFLLIFALISCKQNPQILTVGTIAGPETSLVEEAKKIAAKKYGLQVKIIEFNDYNLPNAALQDGSLDVNVYQHLPYLEETIKAHGYNLKPVGKTFLYPTGIYSEKLKSLTELPEEAIIAIPNDPSNEIRALLLLQKAKLITLKEQKTPTLSDITSNPKHLKIKELDAAQLPRVLPDVHAAIINTNFALPAGLNPEKNAIFIEEKDSPYMNLIVTRVNNAKEQQIKEFVQAFQSEEVKKKAQELFGNTAIPSW
jgi:D-methionine transport system substrate-binding protein